ncbi:MAG: BatD family protein [Ferruginibacter sp.]
MRPGLKKIFSSFIFIFISLLSFAQVSFQSSIYPTQINKDDYVTLKLTVDNASDIQSIQPPSLRKFKVISGPNQESGMSNNNGVVKQYISISYVLQPRQPGTLVIESSSAVVSGKKYKSQPLNLVVKNASSGNNNSHAYSASPFVDVDPFTEERNRNDFNDYILHKNENIVSKVSKNMEMKLVTDKTSCYVGEPIVAAYKLYTRLKSDSKLTKNPSFNGFSVIDLQQPTVTGYAQEKLNGKDYNVYTIRKAQLYPLQSGKIELESATLENNVQFIKEESLQRNGSGSLFDDLLTPQGEAVNQTVTLNSKPITIEVKPLPEAGKPSNFSGAVGEFTIHEKIDKANFSTDETGKLIITISGAGNMQLINAPEINWPLGIDGFEATANDKYNTSSVPLRGDKFFEYSYTVQTPGDYTIPPISFSFFNPKNGTYKTVSTNAIPLIISQGSYKKSDISDGKNNNNKPATTSTIFNVNTIGLVFIVLLFAAGILFLFSRRKKSAASPVIVVNENATEEMENFISQAAYNQLNPLEKTEACLESEECFEFYELLNKEVKAFLSAKFDMPESEINSRKIVNVMDRSGIENSTILQVQKLVEELEWMMYTPFERNEKMDELYHRSQEIIQAINSSLQHHIIQ